MDSNITSVETTDVSAAIRAALPLMAPATGELRQHVWVPRVDRPSTPGVGLGDVKGQLGVDDRMTGWQVGADRGDLCGFGAVDAKHDNYITFSKLLGPSCSPPV